MNKFLIRSHNFRWIEFSLSQIQITRSQYNSFYSRYIHTCTRNGPRAYRVASAADHVPVETNAARRRFSRAHGEN